MGNLFFLVVGILAAGALVCSFVGSLVALAVRPLRAAWPKLTVLFASILGMGAGTMSFFPLNGSASEDTALFGAAAVASLVGFMATLSTPNSMNAVAGAGLVEVSAPPIPVDTDDYETGDEWKPL